MINGLSQGDFDRLAIFNTDDDKSKYCTEYLTEMSALQCTYNENLKAQSIVKGWAVL